MFILNDRRIQTMRSSLKEASDLIKTDNFLPKFRNRQKSYPDEWNKSVEIAKKKDNPEHYLAVVWAKDNIKKSLEWLKKLINITRKKLAVLKAKMDQKASRGLRLKDMDCEVDYNPKGRAKYERMLGGLFNLR